MPPDSRPKALLGLLIIGHGIYEISKRSILLFVLKIIYNKLIPFLFNIFQINKAMNFSL